MEVSFENRLKQNMVQLQSSISVGEDLLASLLSKGVLTFDMCDDIRVQPTAMRKAVTLFDILRRRGPTAENCFVEALQYTNQGHVVEILYRQ